jgi:hypothetical protein
MVPSRAPVLPFFSPWYDATVSEAARASAMQTVKYVFWQEGDVWLGYLQDYPDYWTQGETPEDLQDHLKDLYHDLTSGHLTGIRQVGELAVP